jgi:hypothetical protein
MEQMLLDMVKKIMDQNVLPNLAFVIIIYSSFELWMFYANVNTFVLIIKFLNETWVCMHIAMGLFEMNEMTK